jgi:general secretion pathway protein K
VTLAVLTGLVLLVAGMVATNRETTRTQWVSLEQRRARLMVESGIQRAIAEIRARTTQHATLADDWARLGDQGRTEFTLGRDGFRIQILDASGRINLNQADEETLKRLSLTPEQTAALLDWREQGSSPRPDGAKDEFYNRLKDPYNAKLKPLDSLDELLLIKGFTPASLPTLNETATTDSTSADKDVSGKQKLDVNSASPQDLMAIGVAPDVAAALLQAKGGGFDSLGDCLKTNGMTKEAARSLLDNATVGKETSKSGLVNLNTAPETVLTALGLEEETVRGLVDRQRTGIRSLGEILDVPGMELSTVAELADKVCVGTTAFLVRVSGRAGRTKTAAEATLLVADDGSVTVSRVQPFAFAATAKQWGWEGDPSDQKPVGVEN